MELEFEHNILALSLGPWKGSDDTRYIISQ